MHRLRDRRLAIMMVEEKVIRPHKKRGLILAVLIAVLLAASLIGAWLILFQWNRFSMKMELMGDDRQILEYGTPYTDPGCKAIVYGSIFWKDGVPIQIPVEIHGAVDDSRIGKYEIRYTAQLHGLSADAGRMIRLVDTVCPVIELTEDPEDLEAQPVYPEAGFRAVDNYDGDITDRVVRMEEIGRVIYSVVDSSGNPTTVIREIPVWDFIPPEITLVGGTEYRIPVGERYQEPGYTATDNFDGDLTDRVEVEAEEIIWYQPGEYHITYTVSDERENQTELVRRVIVEPRPRPETEYPEGKVIYLTFDDGPGPDTPRLLDVLEANDVKATFFVTDSGYPEILRRIVRDGHSIAIHTKTHSYYDIYSSPEAFFDDLLGMQELIRQETGVTTWLMRFPGGSSNTISIFNKGIMTLLSAAVEDAGFTYFDWNVDSNDAGGANDWGTVFENVTNGAKHNRISVVLQHDIHSFSVDAVQSIIRWGKENGYTFLPLDQTSPGMHHGVNN